MKSALRSSQWALLLAVVGIACGRAPQPPAAAPTPTPQAWLAAYGRGGLDLYDMETGDPILIPLPGLWLPEADLSYGASNAAGVLAVRTATDDGVPEDIALDLLQLPDGRLIRHIPLLSSRLGDRMLADEAAGHDDWLWEDPYIAIVDRWFVPRWSPDEQTVAFSAALENDSANIYTYNLERDELRRMTEGRDQDLPLGWSPDGEWIVYVEALGFEFAGLPGYEVWEYPTLEDYRPGYRAYSVSAVSTRTGESVQLWQPSGNNRPHLVGWLTPSDLVLESIEPNGTFQELTHVDLATREARVIHPGHVISAALDPETGTMAFSSYEEAPGLDNMLFLSREGGSSTRVDDQRVDGCAGPLDWYPGLGRFMAAVCDGVLGFTLAGKADLYLPGELCLPDVSPDGHWMAFWGCWDYGLRIYDPSGSTRNDYDTGVIVDLSWSPDSGKFYYLEEEESGFRLNSFDIRSGAIRTIDPEARALLRVIQAPGGVRPLAEQLPTPGAVRTATPVPTRVSALSASGPWLVAAGWHGLIAVNPDGSGRSLLFAGSGLVAPADYGQYRWWETATAPSGWVAIRTRSSVFSAPRLLITRLPNTIAIAEVTLLSPELEARMYEPGEDGVRAFLTEQVYLAMGPEGQLKTLSWSPDERLLAFVAAMDGATADLYVYDTVSDGIRQLTDAPNQPRLLGWSPDSRWVLYEEISGLELIEGDQITFDIEGVSAAAADGSGARRIPDLHGPVIIGGWTSPTTFLAVRRDARSRPPFRMELVELERGPVSTVNEGTARDWATDSESGTIAFIHDRKEDMEPPKLFLFSPGTTQAQVVEIDLEPDGPGFPSELRWSTELDTFLVIGETGRLVAVSNQGQVIWEIRGECAFPVPSPDGQWLAFGSCPDRPGIRLFDDPGGSPIQLTAEEVRVLHWLPDSTGLVYQVGRNPYQVMVIGVPAGQASVIDADLGYDPVLQVLGGGQ